jgi:hypothetical protein
MSDSDFVLGHIACGYADAEAQAGAREIGGDNCGPFVEKYLNANHPQQITHQGEAWCVAFFLWCWLQALRPLGRELPFKFTRGSIELWARLQEGGGQVWRIVGSGDQALQDPVAFQLRPGDACFRDFNGNGEPDHVTMVHHVDSEGTLYTIGGNEGKPDTGAPVQVQRRGRLGEIHHLFGFGRIFRLEEGA